MVLTVILLALTCAQIDVLQIHNIPQLDSPTFNINKNG